MFGNSKKIIEGLKEPTWKSGCPNCEQIRAKLEEVKGAGDSMADLLASLYHPAITNALILWRKAVEG